MKNQRQYKVPGKKTLVYDYVKRKLEVIKTKIEAIVSFHKKVRAECLKGKVSENPIT